MKNVTTVAAALAARLTATHLVIGAAIAASAFVCYALKNLAVTVGL